jgi:hypothetical protein
VDLVLRASAYLYTRHVLKSWTYSAKADDMRLSAPGQIRLHAPTRSLGLSWGDPRYIRHGCLDREGAKLALALF